MKVTPYEIRSWRRLKMDKGMAFTGRLYHKGLYECDVILSTVSVTEFEDRFVLEDTQHKYTLLKAYQKS